MTHTGRGGEKAPPFILTQAPATKYSPLALVFCGVNGARACQTVAGVMNSIGEMSSRYPLRVRKQPSLRFSEDSGPLEISTDEKQSGLKWTHISPSNPCEAAKMFPSHHACEDSKLVTKSDRKAANLVHISLISLSPQAQPMQKAMVRNESGQMRMNQDKFRQERQSGRARLIVVMFWVRTLSTKVFLDLMPVNRNQPFKTPDLTRHGFSTDSTEGWPTQIHHRQWKCSEVGRTHNKLTGDVAIAQPSHLMTLLPGCAPFQAIFMLPRNVFPSIASPSTWMSLMTGIPLPATTRRAESQHRVFSLNTTLALPCNVHQLPYRQLR
jgi:hypothetical protein